MDELDLLRSLGSDVTPPDSATRDAARQALLAHVSVPARLSRSRLVARPGVPPRDRRFPTMFAFMRIGLAATALAVLAVFLGLSTQPRRDDLPPGAGVTQSTSTSPGSSREAAIALAHRAIDAFLAAPSFHVRGYMTPVRDGHGLSPSPLPSGADDLEAISFAGYVSTADKLLDLGFEFRWLGTGRLRLTSDGRAFVRLDDHLDGQWQEWATGIPTDVRQTTFPTYLFDTAYIDGEVLRPALELPDLLIAQREPLPCPEAASIGLSRMCDVVDLALTGVDQSTIPADLDPAPTSRPVASWETRIRLFIDQGTSLPDTVTFRGPVPGQDLQGVTLHLREYGVDVDVTTPSSVAEQPFDPDTLPAD